MSILYSRFLRSNARYGRRLLTVLTNAANSLTLPLLNVLVPFLVIRSAGLTLWGEFVQVMVVVQLAAHIMAWGNKEYLLRSFSLMPARIAAEWRASLVTRASLFAMFCLVVLFLGYSPIRLGLVLLWGGALFLYQAIDVLILYRRDFVFALAVELSGLVTTLGVVAWRGAGLAVDDLIAIFGVVHLIKALVFLARFRDVTIASPSPLVGEGDRGWGQTISPSPLVGEGAGGWGAFTPGYFRLALPFFLLGFSGMLQSRVDLYVVNLFLAQRDIAQYQVFMNLMIYLQSISVFVLMPFVKSLYRLGRNATLRLTARLFLLGLALLLPGLPLAYLALTYVYHITLPLVFLMLGGLLILPAYTYLPTIYALFKQGRQSVVLVINLVGILVSLSLSVALLPRWGMLGGVVAGAVAQWVMLGVYFIQDRTTSGRSDLAVSELS